MTRKSTTSAGGDREPGTAPGCLLAPHLQVWRLHRGRTSVQLAAQAGVRFATVSRAENGHGLRRQTLDALAAALTVPVETLVSSEAPPDAACSRISGAHIPGA